MAETGVREEVKYALRLTEAQHRELRAHLFPGDGNEAVALWKAFIRANGSPDFSKQGGGKRQEEWKYKLGKYGTKFAQIYSGLIESGDVDDYEFFRLSGIKPKYQKDYLVNAPTASLQDAQDDVDG